jgi:hypothetical protein
MIMILSVNPALLELMKDPLFQVAALAGAALFFFLVAPAPLIALGFKGSEG